MSVAALQARCHRCGQAGWSIRLGDRWMIECSACWMRPSTSVATMEEAWAEWNRHQCALPAYAEPAFEPWWTGEEARA